MKYKLNTFWFYVGVSVFLTWSQGTWASPPQTPQQSPRDTQSSSGTSAAALAASSSQQDLSLSAPVRDEPSSGTTTPPPSSSSRASEDPLAQAKARALERQKVATQVLATFMGDYRSFLSEIRKVFQEKTKQEQRAQSSESKQWVDGLVEWVVTIRDGSYQTMIASPAWLPKGPLVISIIHQSLGYPFYVGFSPVLVEDPRGQIPLSMASCEPELKNACVALYNFMGRLPYLISSATATKAAIDDAKTKASVLLQKHYAPTMEKCRRTTQSIYKTGEALKRAAEWVRHTIQQMQDNVGKLQPSEGEPSRIPPTPPHHVSATVVAQWTEEMARRRNDEEVAAPQALETLATQGMGAPETLASLAAAIESFLKAREDYQSAHNPSEGAFPVAERDLAREEARKAAEKADEERDLFLTTLSQCQAAYENFLELTYAYGAKYAQAADDIFQTLYKDSQRDHGARTAPHFAPSQETSPSDVRRAYDDLQRASYMVPLARLEAAIGAIIARLYPSQIPANFEEALEKVKAGIQKALREREATIQHLKESATNKYSPENSGSADIEFTLSILATTARQEARKEMPQGMIGKTLSELYLQLQSLFDRRPPSAPIRDGTEEPTYLAKLYERVVLAASSPLDEQQKSVHRLPVAASSGDNDDQ